MVLAHTSIVGRLSEFCNRSVDDDRLWHSPGMSWSGPLRWFSDPARRGVQLVQPMAAIGNRMMMMGGDPVHGNELWVHDPDAANVPLTLPSITGKRVVGSVLTSTTGTWSHSATFQRQWLRNGVPIAGASGTTYTVSSRDVGKVVSVRVTASSPGAAPVYATSAGVGSIKHASSASLTASRSGRSVTLVVQVSSKAPNGPSGLVRITDGNQALRTASLSRGKYRIVLKGQATRTHIYTVQYAGNSTIAGSTAWRVVTVR